MSCSVIEKMEENLCVYDEEKNEMKNKANIA
jgi:hypothetical protein